MSNYADQRKERIETLQNYIKNEQPVEANEVIAEGMKTFGLTKSKIQEYIDVLKASNEIEVNDGEVTTA